MTTLIDLDSSKIFEQITDAGALEVAQRIIQGEAVYHEARMTQLREMERAISVRLQQVRKT